MFEEKTRDRVNNPQADDSPVYKKDRKNKKKVAIIGGGWFGTHTAIQLSASGYGVTLYEKNDAIFSGTSGTFGVRIHAGQHYPRSASTRETCYNGFHAMRDTYPELCNEHLYSVYALGKIDADGKPSKVSAEKFDLVCSQFKFKGEIDLEKSDYNPSEVIAAYDIDEPSAIVGVRLRKFFEGRLQAYNVTVKCNFTVTKVQRTDDGLTLVGNEKESAKYNAVIDSTGFQQAFLPLSKPLPFRMNIVFQPCLALVYKDRTPSAKPISFIVMDGWFPCLMPYDDRSSTATPMNKYIMTHGKWTIMGSYDSPVEANGALRVIDDKFVEKNIKTQCEKEMVRFWPNFLKRFQYETWVGSVLAKMKTEREFRGSVVLREPTVGIISIFPGKITNVFGAAREAQHLIERINVETSVEGYEYTEDGVLNKSKEEIMAPVITKDHNTCELRTFQGLLDSKQNKSEPKLVTNNNPQASILINATDKLCKFLGAGILGYQAKHIYYEESQKIGVLLSLLAFSVLGILYICNKKPNKAILFKEPTLERPELRDPEVSFKLTTAS